MKYCVFITLAIIYSSLSLTVSRASPLYTQAPPISGVTTFDDLYSGTPVDLTGLKSAGGGGLVALNVAGYDARLFASSSLPESGISIEPINGQSAMLHAYNLNPATNLGSIQISSNDKSYFDLNAVDITIDSFSTGTSQIVRLIGYRNGVIVSGAVLLKTVTAATSGGLLVNFDVSAIPAFKGITAFSVQTDGSYFFKRGIGVDNINAVNFRTVLPVNLLSFDALLQKDKTVLLKWSTASEVNNAYFLTDRSSNGTDFMPLAKIAGNDASAGLVNYEYTDAHPLSGNNFYRLTQVDIDGRQKILSIKKVAVNESATLSLYPNPVVGNSFTLNYGKNVSAAIPFKLIDAAGKMVFAGKIYQQSQPITLPALSAGVYTIQLPDGRSLIFEKK